MWKKQDLMGKESRDMSIEEKSEEKKDMKKCEEGLTFIIPIKKVTSKELEKLYPKKAIGE